MTFIKSICEDLFNTLLLEKFVKVKRKTQMSHSLMLFEPMCPKMFIELNTLKFGVCEAMKDT